MLILTALGEDGPPWHCSQNLPLPLPRSVRGTSTHTLETRIVSCYFSFRGVAIVLGSSKFSYGVSEAQANLSCEFMNFSFFQGFTDKPVTLYIQIPVVTCNFKLK